MRLPELPADPPPVAPNFEAPARPLPSAERVGVDVTNQTPITLNEAIALALQNNNDIDSSRIDVKIAEFNLTAARGAYDPLLSNESFFESRTTPTSSTISGGVNGFVTQQTLPTPPALTAFRPSAGVHIGSTSPGPDFKPRTKTRNSIRSFLRVWSPLTRSHFGAASGLITTVARSKLRRKT